MKFKGKIVDHIMLAGGKQRLTIETTDDLRAEYDRLHEKEVGAEIKEYRKPRSLDANAYFHVLVNKIAISQGVSDDEAKRWLVVRYGTVERDEDGNVIAAMLLMSADMQHCHGLLLHKTLAVMKRDIDEARTGQWGDMSLGDDCDVYTWLKFREWLEKEELQDGNKE